MSDMQSIAASVARIFSPFNQSSLFHFIDKDDQSAWNHPEPGGERLLGNGWRRVEYSQDAGMLRREADLPKSLGKLRRRVGPHLSNEKGR
ncbi:MAG TPA: hypothetical protein VEI01_15875 [Terriglobales bacterium]|nr:hypothetical protein [Terriglobales bacterium]